MRNFDKQKLIADLEGVPPPLRVAFAAACAERQMPAYRAFASQSGLGDAEALRRFLDDAWLNPAKSDEPEFHRQLQDCLNLIPKEDTVNPWTEEATHAQDAGISLAHTLRTRISGEAEEAAWSAQVAYESLDNFVINRENIDTNLPDSEARVLSHPLVQAELARQQRDLDELRGVAPRNVRQVVAILRDRAKSDGSTFFAIEQNITRQP